MSSYKGIVLNAHKVAPLPIVLPTHCRWLSHATQWRGREISMNHYVDGTNCRLFACDAYAKYNSYEQCHMIITVNTIPTSNVAVIADKCPHAPFTT